MKISASSIRNYMLDDPLLLWADYFGVSSLSDAENPCAGRQRDGKSPFKEYILNQGHVYEQQVWKDIQSIAAVNGWSTLQVVPDNVYASEDVRYRDMSRDAIAADEYDIIYQAVLHSDVTYGTVDLLVRPSVLPVLFPGAVVPRLCRGADYLVVDIKHSTITVSPEGWLQNAGNASIPAYKSQVLIYNRMLGELCAVVPYAFIYGKDGVIGFADYTDRDRDIIDKTDAGIEFIERMRAEGHTWRLLPQPSVKELYPNMKNIDLDPANMRLKRELATAIGEITDVWYCGYNRRQRAHRAGVKSWRDPRFCSDLVGITRGRGNALINGTLDKMLDINRRAPLGSIRIEHPPQRLNPDEALFYIDYETFNSDMGEEMIFMVGLGWIEAGEWQFECFIAKERTPEEEERIMNDCNRFILQAVGSRRYRLIHWSNAEVAFYNRYKARHPDAPELPFYDLLEQDFSGKVFISGCLNYSLKTIGNTLYRAGVIPIGWSEDNPCSNGLDAMYAAHEYYAGRNNMMGFIRDYNEIDCKMMYLIHELILGLCSVAQEAV